MAPAWPDLALDGLAADLTSTFLRQPVSLEGTTAQERPDEYHAIIFNFSPRAAAQGKASLATARSQQQEQTLQKSHVDLLSWHFRRPHHKRLRCFFRTKKTSRRKLVPAKGPDMP